MRLPWFVAEVRVRPDEVKVPPLEPNELELIVRAREPEEIELEAKPLAVRYGDRFGLMLGWRLSVLLGLKVLGCKLPGLPEIALVTDV